MKKLISKVATPPLPSSLPPTSQPLLAKNKETNGPGRPKSPLKKLETSPDSPDQSNNNDNKMVKRLNEMVKNIIL